MINNCICQISLAVGLLGFFLLAGCSAAQDLDGLEIQSSAMFKMINRLLADQDMDGTAASGLCQLQGVLSGIAESLVEILDLKAPGISLDTCRHEPGAEKIRFMGKYRSGNNRK